ncbi:methyltransferase domain-containing protein [Bacillus infantis]|uniref:methyltransferase domain-containing protein n=1 Tax=Bacillus infantis TaxID=324767 RepID=UPI001CD5B061|nr:methyltransferase domain-containing protein [Bacillus infantis]MCA1033588.1 methyltransferase domain-containing protein [Bacillus infantis]
MEKNLDKIAQAYHGDLGPLMAQKTRDRVQWIIKNTAGGRILDIGCSQGLIPILLAKEGHQVTGVDVSAEAIDYAKKLLKQENSAIQRKVSFLHEDFLQGNYEGKYDCILLTEVLEHLYDSHEFLKKARSLLQPEGQILITVPFGINDFPDHKRTLYVLEIFKELYPYFDIMNVHFLGKWIGFTGKKAPRIKSGSGIVVPLEMIGQMEKSFYSIERELTNQMVQLKQKLARAKEHEKQQNEELHSLRKREEAFSIENRLLTERVRMLEQQAASHKAWEIEKQDEHNRFIFAKDEHIADLKERLFEKERQLDRFSMQIEAQSQLIRNLEETIQSPLQQNRSLKDELNGQLAVIAKEIDKNREEGNALARQLTDSLQSASRGLSAEMKNQLSAFKNSKDSFEVKMKKKQSELTRKLDQTLEGGAAVREMISDVLGHLDEAYAVNREGFHSIGEFMASQKEAASQLEKGLFSSVAEAVTLCLEEQKQLLSVAEQAARKEAGMLKEKEAMLVQKEEMLAQKDEMLARMAKEIAELKAAGQSAASTLEDAKAKALEYERKYKKDLHSLEESLKLAAEEKARTKEELQLAVKESARLSSEITFLKERYEEDLSKAKEEVLLGLQESEAAIKQLLEENERYRQLQMRYSAIKNSKLGKVTVKYWGFKNKMRFNSKSEETIKF